MPSMAHEILVDLFKNRPSLGAELLSEALGIALPSYTEARLISIDLSQIRPAEYRADIVVLLLKGDVPVSVLIIEVQLGIDPRKRFTWPEYSMSSRAAHACPVGLLVVAPDPNVAAWCAEPIATGIPGFVLRPPVLGREAVPVVKDPAEAARRPSWPCCPPWRTARASWERRSRPRCCPRSGGSTMKGPDFTAIWC